LIQRCAYDVELMPEATPILLMVRELGIGGTERQLTETARYLSRERYIPHVGCFRPEGLRRKDLDAAGVPILHLPVYSFRSPAAITAAWTLVRYIRQHRIRIVHTFDAPLNVFATPIARAAGTPLVLSSQRGHRDLAGQGMKKLLRATDRIVDAIVVNCEAMRRHLVDDENVPEQKIRLCYNGIDTNRFQRHEVPTLDGAVVIGTVCALRPEKGLDTLVRAFSRCRHPGAKLLIVGSGPFEPELRRLINESGIDEYCHLEPATSNVAEWLSRMDIFVLPSRSEALSNALMEAMSCGCCPVASRVGGNPELIDDGINGSLFPVDDWEGLAVQLAELIRDESLRRRFAMAATAKIHTRFTHAAAAETMQEIYDCLLDRATAGAPASL
jgi:L-malate glycosyltransferase